MLKPPNEPEPTPGDTDRPVGELVHELIEDGKAYARAEVGVVKAIATAKANALKLPAILFGIAFLLRSGGDHGFSGRRRDGLATLIGPLAGGTPPSCSSRPLPAACLAWRQALEEGPVTRESPEVPPPGSRPSAPVPG